LCAGRTPCEHGQQGVAPDSNSSAKHPAGTAASGESRLVIGILTLYTTLFSIPGAFLISGTVASHEGLPRLVPGGEAPLLVLVSPEQQTLVGPALVCAKPTAFGRATLEGSADAARLFGLVTRPALSPPCRTRPFKSPPWRHRNPSGRRATGRGGRADLVRSPGPSFGRRGILLPPSAPAGPSGTCLAPLWGASQSHGLWPWLLTGGRPLLPHPVDPPQGSVMHAGSRAGRQPPGPTRAGSRPDRGG
jgi:hypothetical protein